ncbi:NAD(P)-dependent oxidoreductase [Acuticoccus sp. M5D2P5]|uniref:NAD-dependent epimerase/dehydratase family protein n=1 Tax=Acuticoccus kalidii TaxID=2910977 RepID=UPI001F422FB4|nr:NAD(P)-dependent oxidoreductase [Acuticoccus kalidii]MCF3934769.1 NAD(P)-dependent oxidoreductase [Acuticoccus kalidii]
MTTPYGTILITGAAGNLGTELRRGLAPLAKTLRLADRVEIADVKANEEAMIFDLGDEAATIAATKGVDAIVHMGGAPMERPWQDILDSSIRGSYHIYEGARQHGVKRIAYASSVHAIGYHSLTDHIDADTPTRPDTLYGVSKCFVESLSRLYWDKFGIETACVRIFSSFPEPADRRHLWSWLSFEDMIRLFSAALTAPHVGHTILFGMSDNKVKPVDNTKAGHLGFHPQDSSEPYRAALEARTPVADPMARATQCYGGAFVDFPHPDDAQ